MRPAIVELQGIRKSYGIGTPVVTEVLHGIDLRLEEGLSLIHISEPTRPY